MKRSEVNTIISEAIEFFRHQPQHLPPWAYWTAQEWKMIGSQADEVRLHGLGWIVTDFGKGNFAKMGLTLFVMRNGHLYNGQPLTTKTYAEKAMMVRPGQVTPWHFHWKKTEDLINRGGGRLEVELGWVEKDERTLSSKDIKVQVDGITRHLSFGEKLILAPGESVTLPPYLCHQFCGHPLDRAVCVGEVSNLNDDSTDNCFIQGIGPQIINEDEPVAYWLNSEYPSAIQSAGAS